ncbi:MAG: DUF302 domain-containing protein [Magnetococcales bacterium]|nr:DUF302 domain-containing protein [Magnetococcales bacterium]
MSNYALIKTVSTDFDATIEAVKAALMTQGFGVLTEIDLSATFKKKLDIDYPRSVILGACNPKFAHQALSAEKNISTLLPCNVVVREDENGSVEVAALNPNMMESVVNNAGVTTVANQVTKHIQAALDVLK